MAMATRSDFAPTSRSEAQQAYGFFLEWPPVENPSRDLFIQQALQMADELEARAATLRRAADMLPSLSAQQNNASMVSLNDQTCNAVINLSQSVSISLSSLALQATSLLSKPSRLGK